MSAHSVDRKRTKRRYPAGLCQQCGSPEISPRSPTGVRCTPCLDRASVLKKRRRERIGKDAYITPTERSRLEAHVCVKCGGELAANHRRMCESHRLMQRESENKRRRSGPDGTRPLLFIHRYIWRGMKARCENPNEDGYANYGGRGITVCERWRSSFSAFFADMGPRTSPEHSIDRKDNEGNYDCGKCDDCRARGVTKLNCRWATQEEQDNNKRTSHKITVDGETLTVAQWARRLGVKAGKIHARLNAGMPEEEAIRKASYAK